MASIILIASCLLTIFIAYVTWIVYYQYTYWKRRKMLHAKLVPIFGNNAPIFFRTLAFPYHIENIYKKFPGARYYGMFDFSRPTVLLKDPELICDVGIKSFESFMDHDAFVTEEMDPIAGRNLFSLRGQRWKDVRQMLSPSFTAARMRILFELIAECSKDFVQYFLNHPEIAKNFEAKDAFARYTSDVIGTAAFGIKVNSMSDQNNEFYFHGRAATTLDGWFIARFELLKHLTRLTRFFGVTFLPQKTDQFFKNLIKETVKMRKEKGIVRQDMIHLLMLAMDKDDENVTVDDIISQAFFFFIAGFDTSSSLMCFLAQELAANPDIQDKLYQEIDEQIIENNGKVTYDSLVKMKYLDMVISETLRKYPAAPFINRLCVKDYEFPPPMDGYPKYKMEKGTTIMLPIFGLHRDSKYFPEPERFDPERFNKENKTKIVPCTYIPFGLGPRQCIGNRFVLMETKILIIEILRKFEIKFTEKSQHPVVFGLSTFTMTAKDKFWLRFVDRKKSS